MGKLGLLGICLIICWFYQEAVVLANPNEGDVRLADGGAPSQGRVEVYINGSWWTVCASWFRFNEGRVVCRQLGLPELSRVYYRVAFGQGNGSILSEEYDCQGNETSLLECSKTGYKPYCIYPKGVGIVCGPLVVTVAGCGGNFKQSNGTINFSKPIYLYDDLYCNWTIGNVGISNAVLFLSLKRLYFANCLSEFLRVYSSSGSEIFSRSGCSRDQPVYIDVPFSGGDFITLQTYLNYAESRLIVEFFVIRRSLQSALSPPTAWDIHGYNTSQTSLMLDWSNVPAGLEVDFFLWTLNRTRPVFDKGMSTLYGVVANSSTTSVNVSGLPVYSQYIALVYLVDMNGEVYKSEITVVETDEGVPRRGPNIVDLHVNVFEPSISFGLRRIYQEDARGRILGYIITYRAVKNINNSRTMIIHTNTTRITLRNLTARTTYIINIAGFTRKGTGKSKVNTVATVCGGRLTDDSDYFYSNNYPNSLYNYKNIPAFSRRTRDRCIWNINPQSNTKMIWLTFVDLSLGIITDEGYCRLGVTISIYGREKDDRKFLLDVCGPKITNETFLIEGHFVNLDAYGFNLDEYHQSRYNQSTRVLGHYEAEVNNISVIIGEKINTWTKIEANVTNLMIKLSWPTPPSGFLDGSTVDKYLILYSTIPSRKFYRVVWSPADKTHLKITGLRHFTNYSLIVVSILTDESRRGNTGWIRVQTEEEVPIRGPDIRDSRAIDYSSIFISWDRIPPKLVRGILQGYRIYISFQYKPCYLPPPFKNITVSPDTHEATITGLQQYSYYVIWVKAFTSKGEGPQGDRLEIRTKCGAALHSGSGVIESPGFPYIIESDTECTWNIDPEDGNKSVLLFFQVFNLPLSFRCQDFNLTVRDDSSIKPEAICGDRAPPPFLARKLRVDFTSTHGHYTRNWRGFQARYIVLNESVVNAPLVNNWNISITNVNPSSIDVTWTYYVPDNSYSLQMYAVACTPTNHETGTTVVTANKTETHLKVRRLRAMTEYRCQVLAVVEHTTYDRKVSLKGSEAQTVSTSERGPPAPASIPQTLSNEERNHSVRLEIQGMNVSQWSQPLQYAFKQAVATAATKYCSETDKCKSVPASARRKRAANYITFTEDQVHILPGYPKQISEDPLLASLAFYLQFPPGTSSDDAIKKDILVSIVQGSLSDISNAINSNIIGVQALFADTLPTTPTTSVPSTQPIVITKYIIAGSVAGGMLLLIASALIIMWKCSEIKNRIYKRVAGIPVGTSEIEMVPAVGTNNEAYPM